MLCTKYKHSLMCYIDSYQCYITFNTMHIVFVVGGAAQWLERRSMIGILSLACAMTCS